MIDTAIVNGNIKEPKESSISSQEAVKLGICIGDGVESDWQLIDEEIEGQTAVTIWRTLKQWPLYNARMNTVSLVELKPKTGRYHQLRRHMVSLHVSRDLLVLQSRVSLMKMGICF